MMRKVSLVVLGAMAGAATVTIGQQSHLFAGGSARAAISDTYRSLNLFGDVFEKVRSDYVEKPDEQKLIESAINGMLTSLDPHSSYMDPKSFRDMQVQTRGEFGGLGIEVTHGRRLIKVVTPIDDTPASKAGILAGDIITAIDGETVQGMTLNQAVDKMRGAVNTPITLTILRKGSSEPHRHQARRATIIQIKSVRSRKEGDDVGYIRITQFNEQTFDGLKAAIDEDHRANSGATSSRATSSTCATIRAACSTRRSPSPTRSSIAARSFRPAAATPTRRSATTRGRAI